MFSKLLIANRGEIAVRIIRTCKRMGIATVAVYSEADQNALHVKMADEAYCIGPARPDLSYLNIPNILSVAHATNCEAIHPGYGFLSENPDFAEIVEKCGFTFIGPDSRAIERMGQKSVARDLMIRSGVPVMPGSQGSVETSSEGIEIARKIGFPVLVKATSGGGGKGMRLVEHEEDFDNLFKMAQGEAEASFGDKRVYVEKYMRNPRHVEVQIIADQHGKVVALGERECSIQRRHQKLIEESPSPAVSPELRRKMAETAVKAAKAINYHNAGTIEFLLDSDGSFFFMEMNTRLQVEHPVTEMVCHFDLVELQLRVAAGEALPIDGELVEPDGWAVECRVNAEDPVMSFIPCPGRIEKYLVPGGPCVRVDSAAYQGYVISSNYDSMVAKLIVWGHTRDEALDRMNVALREYEIKGIETTIPFHIHVINHPEFRSGNFSTSFVDRNFAAFIKEVSDEKNKVEKAASAIA
ncbi:MAG: acetyl-CoA carboxylase biotin carboxylase subunit [Erysipelotrichia bacterium]|nr:acetyl-CoA carboxylase biotin carboxylase subunit [Erysipelotrichia bacterium]